MLEQLLDVVLLVLVIIGLIATASFLFRRFGRQRFLVPELRRFFGRDLNGLAIVSRKFTIVDLPNLQRAIDRLAGRPGSSRKIIGYSSQFGAGENSLRALIAPSGPMGRLFASVELAPVVERDVDIDVDQRLACVENGIHLLDTPDGKAAIHVRSERFVGNALEIEVAVESSEAGSALIQKIRDEIASNNVYRHRILSLECDAEEWGSRGCAHVRFHRFPAVERSNIILPEATLQLIERNTSGFFRHAETLRRAGRSVKRGILLHGRPGTGKTFTAKWLARSLPNVTVILLSGEQLWLIKQCCQMARLLAPALVIMEDVDLIATARDERRHPMYQITLHQLLNEMDGLAGETEVLFLLTTNRPDMLEEALISRPGRIDQAIEYPLPDAECRGRLFDLYSRGMKVALENRGDLIVRTEGTSPAFIQELFRKAALFAAEETPDASPELLVRGQHVEAALREMVAGGDLLPRLFGYEGDD